MRVNLNDLKKNDIIKILRTLNRGADSYYALIDINENIIDFISWREFEEWGYKNFYRGDNSGKI